MWAGKIDQYRPSTIERDRGKMWFVILYHSLFSFLWFFFFGLDDDIGCFHYSACLCTAFTLLS